MKTQFVSRSIGGAVALACLGFSTAALADRNCSGTIGPITIEDNVVVQNARCTLSGTIVKGNVLVYSGGRLTLLGAQIEGNIQAKDAISVTVEPNTCVDGDIQFEELKAGAYAANVRYNTVGGNIQMTKNTLTKLSLLSNRVDGDLQAFENRSSSALIIRANNIRQNLQCKSNDRAPTGGANIVGGSKEDQCRNL